MAITQSSGRGPAEHPRRPIDLETGKHPHVGRALAGNAASTTGRCRMAIEAMYPGKRLILCISGQRPVSSCEAGAAMAGAVGMPIRLHFIPSYCPTSGARSNVGLWGLMHRHCTHNKCYAGFKRFHSGGTFNFSAREGARGTGMSTATRSPTTSASSLPPIFGFSRELSIYPVRGIQCVRQLASPDPLAPSLA